jgi:hypothetical protein
VEQELEQRSQEERKQLEILKLETEVSEDSGYGQGRGAHRLHGRGLPELTPNTDCRVWAER